MDLRNHITLEPDPYWPDRFRDERDRIRGAADDQLLGVFHVGSTAIPDVSGKPALDLIAVFEDTNSLGALAETLTVDEGYEREADTPVVVRWGEDYAVFVKLHTRNDEKVRNQLMFRDYLREHPNARRGYDRVKRDAAAEHPDDLEAYTRAKWDFVSSVIEQARAEEYDEQLPEFA